MSEVSYIFDATDENFQQGVIENSYKTPVLVIFWTSWSNPSKELITLLETLASDMRGQFVLAKVNNEMQKSLSKQFNVRNSPTVLILKNGDIVEQFSGLLPEENIREAIERHLTTEADIIRNKAVGAIQTGDLATGKKLLLDAEKLEPDNVTIQIDLAHLEAQEKQYDAAKTRLNSLKIIDREKDVVITLLNKIELAMVTENAPSIDELLVIIQETPEDSQSRYQLAIQLINTDEYENGLEHLLYIVQRDNKFQDGAAQKAMLLTFTLLEEDDPLIGKYRRKMFNALH